MELGGRPRGWVSAVPRTQRAKSSVVVLLPQRIVSTPPPGRSARGPAPGLFAKFARQLKRVDTGGETPASRRHKTWS
jgi:hypothetical protein